MICFMIVFFWSHSFPTPASSDTVINICQYAWQMSEPRPDSSTQDLKLQDEK